MIFNGFSLTVSAVMLIFGLFSSCGHSQNVEQRSSLRLESKPLKTPRSQWQVLLPQGSSQKVESLYREVLDLVAKAEMAWEESGTWPAAAAICQKVIDPLTQLEKNHSSDKKTKTAKIAFYHICDPIAKQALKALPAKICKGYWIWQRLFRTLSARNPKTWNSLLKKFKKCLPQKTTKSQSPNLARIDKSFLTFWKKYIVPVVKKRPYFTTLSHMILGRLPSGRAKAQLKRTNFGTFRNRMMRTFKKYKNPKRAIKGAILFGSLESLPKGGPCWELRYIQIRGGVYAALDNDFKPVFVWGKY